MNGHDRTERLSTAQAPLQDSSCLTAPFLCSSLPLFSTHSLNKETHRYQPSHSRGQRSQHQKFLSFVQFVQKPLVRAFRSLYLSPSSSPFPSLCFLTLPYLTADKISSWHPLTYLLVYMEASYSRWNIIKSDHPICVSKTVRVRPSFSHFSLSFSQLALDRRRTPV